MKIKLDHFFFFRPFNRNYYYAAFTDFFLDRPVSPSYITTFTGTFSPRDAPESVRPSIKTEI